MRDVSLEDIDGRAWGDPPADATRLVTEVHRLRRVPIGHLNVEDLRLLIGQHESLDVLVPLALEKLAADPLAEGDFYPGDLLAAVLTVPSTYWHAHPPERDRLAPVVDAVADPRGRPARRSRLRHRRRRGHFPQKARPLTPRHRNSAPRPNVTCR